MRRLVGGTYGGRCLDALLLHYRSTTGQAPPEKEKEQNRHYDQCEARKIPERSCRSLTSLPSDHVGWTFTHLRSFFADRAFSFDAHARRPDA